MAADRLPPDVVGYTLDDAHEILAAAQWTSVEVAETRPPRRTLVSPARVVRERLAAGDRVQLIVCGERAEEPGV
jgi:hypothetical protein